MGTELIMGMEEVINYLKELEAKNKKLEEELETCRKVRFSVSEMCQELREEKKKLKEENETLQTKATIYEFMNEFMEKADLYGDYWDFVREYYPDERKKAGEIMSSDEEESDDEEITEPESDKP